MGKDRLYKEGLKIDVRNRVTIPSELLKELKINSGSKIVIYANFDEDKIIIKKEKKK